MNIKNIAVIVALCLVIVFLAMDKCGSSTKLDQLRGEYKKASEVAKIEKQIKEETIKEQKEKIVALNTTIEVLNTTIEAKDEDLAELDNKVTDLEGEFGNLTDKDEKITNLQEQVRVWKEKFSLSQSIIADKDDVIFSLNKKYESQLIISNSYKTMYDTLTLNTKSLQKIVTAQDWQIKKLTIISRVKTGIVVVIAGVIIYSLLKD